MLDISLSPTVPDSVWESLDLTASLPCEVEEFLASTATAFAAESQRRHQRVGIRGRALVRHEGAISGVYTIDLSPSGVGFYSPVQLFPLQEIVLRAEQGDALQLVVVACKRYKEGCYRCGAHFADGPMDTVAYRDFTHELMPHHRAAEPSLR